MNVDNINTVIEMIRKEEVAEFDMGTFGSSDTKHPCGTAACIAGFACLAAGHSTSDIIFNRINVEKVARQYFDIDIDSSSLMFYGNSTYLGNNFDTLGEIKSADAIAMLENFKITKEVDWSVCPNFIPEEDRPLFVSDEDDDGDDC